VNHFPIDDDGNDDFADLRAIAEDSTIDNTSQNPAINELPH
jgi:hypothetical protein